MIRTVNKIFQNKRTLKNKLSQGGYILQGLIVFVVLLIVASFFIPRTVVNKVLQDKQNLTQGTSSKATSNQNSVLQGDDISASTTENSQLITHVTLPKSVKGLYISSWVAGTPSLRSKIVAEIEKTEANAVILDIKDYTGMISFKPYSAHLQEVGCIDERIRDIDGFIKELHDKNIYVIGRVAVFQDPCMVKKMPDQAVKTKDGSKVWKDHKGISWMDTGSQKVWDYNIEIARIAHQMGFDEINFDYIRYPSDGNMADISFPVSGTREKSASLEAFFKYIDKNLRGGNAIGATRLSATSTVYTTAADPAFDELVARYGINITPEIASKPDTKLDGKKIETTIENMPRIIVSADLFGMVTNNKDDLGIGQVLEKVAPYIDFIGPMVYPSHYPKNFIGISNPAAEPYAIVKHAMSGGVAKLQAIGLNPLKLRPWLQDFNLGATYTAAMVRAQIKATYDVGLTSWMLWDASNTYTPGGSLGI